jgi:hypothetical protein
MRETPVKTAPWLCALAALAIAAPAAPADPGDLLRLHCVNRKLHGQLVDYTNNHGHDRRLWSEALHEKRDLYVYLPPGFDPNKQYPLALWLHAFRQDEHAFLESVVQVFDKAMACGELPPFIIAAPDGSIGGCGTWVQGGSFFINSPMGGNYEDFVIHDVWNFVVEHYPVRPEREAHVMMGASMGGFGAYNLAFKHPDMFKVVVGIFPPLNLRWVDCHGNHFGHFDPCCWGWREQYRPHELIAVMYGVPVFMWQIVRPIYDNLPDVMERISEENPIEMLERLDIKPGMFDLYIAHAGKDQFNIAAQVESFLYVAKERGIDITVGYEPNGRHNERTALKLFPDIAVWLSEKLTPYAPVSEP